MRDCLPTTSTRTAARTTNTAGTTNTLLAAAMLASVVSSTGARADSVPAARDLTPTEVREHMKRVDPAIGACYRNAVGDLAGAGKLEVVLAIHRKGLVDHIDVRAPGLPAKSVTKIDGCIRDALTGITFPSRRVGTTAVVPYFWQKTASIGAGPQASCWDAKGCRAGAASSSSAAPWTRLPAPDLRSHATSERPSHQAPRLVAR